MPHAGLVLSQSDHTHPFALLAQQIQAPRTLYVQEISQSSDRDDDDGRILYPRTAVPVEAFELRTGRKQLQSFRSSSEHPAHTFCKVCGVHLLQAVDPAATELYVNVQCLDRATFVWKSSGSKQAPPPSNRGRKTGARAGGLPDEAKVARPPVDSEQHPQPPQQVTTTTSNSGSSSPNLSSASDPELIVLSSEHKHKDPEFTLTAASSISHTSSFDNNDDYSRSTTNSELEAQAYKLRRNLKTAEDPNNNTASLSSAAAADTLADSFMAVPAPPATLSSSEEEEDQAADQKMPAVASATQSFPDVSFASSSSSTQSQQLRKFLGKHVSASSPPPPSDGGKEEEED